MSKEIKFFIQVHGELGTETQKLVVYEIMEPDEIKTAFRTTVFANEDENVKLILPPITDDLSSKYDVLSEQVVYRLVVTKLVRFDILC